MIPASRLRFVGRWLLVFGLLAFAGPVGQPAARAASGPPAARPPLKLRSGAIDTSRTENVLDALPAAFEAHRRYVLQLDGPITPDRRAMLRTAGVALGEYLPVHAYLATLGRADPAALAGLDFVTWVSPFKPEWKIDPDLGIRPLKTQRRRALAAAGQCQATIVLLAGEGPGEAIDTLGELGATILSQNRVGEQWMIDVILRPADAGLLAELPTLQFIEDAPEHTPRNDTNQWIIQSNVIGQTPIWEHGLHGEDQIAGFIDTTIRESHCAFDDTVPVGPTHRKIVAMRNAGAEGLHGTHVAATLVGDRDIYGAPDLYDGIAFAARISVSELAHVVENPSTLYARFLDAHNDGARLHSNSWGDDLTTAYTTWCRQIDQFTYDYEDNLVLFAVTNSATLKTPENAKNVLAVAASQDAPDQDFHCSGGTGPTADGRRKPEVYAPGCGTLSADLYPPLPCAFIGLSGTSTACPVVAGAGLLVRQYFTGGYYPSGVPAPADARVPSGALIKAVLINAAVDMTGIAGYPGDLEGWGRVVLDNSLAFPGDTRTLWVQDVMNTNGLTTGDSDLHQFRVVGNSQVLRITLVYTEPPATVGAGDPVINNLDLEVLAPDGTVYNGNVFSGGVSVPGGSADDRNNVEQVHLPAPYVGIYTVTVTGAAVNVRTQGYALVATGQVTGDLASPDCNTNGLPDEQDILGGTSSDCQPNGLPDECESLDDCNTNGIADVCESWPDCNGNSIPDECEVDRDCDTNGTLDDCEGVPDCNANGWPDTCDLLHGTSDDCQPNGVPDECETWPETTIYTIPEGVSIPDNDPVGVSRFFTVPDHRTIIDLDLNLQIEHSWNGDLIVTLFHDGVTAALIDRPGYPTQNPLWGYGDAGFDVLLDDAAFTSIESFTAVGEKVMGTFRPAPDLLESFIGLDAYGTWTITVADVAPGDTGTLEGWSLHVTEPPGPVPGCYGPGDCDGNGVVNLDDFASFANCLVGPAGGVGPNCGCADLNDDDRVDLADFAEFQQVFGGRRMLAAQALPYVQPF